jgi:plasmid stabilization system protein ParE
LIQWTLHATDCVGHIFDHIAILKGKPAGYDATGRIVRVVQQLSAAPLAGKPCSREGLREIEVPGSPFVVVYTIEGEQVIVLAVYHRSQVWPEKVTA